MIRFLEKLTDVPLEVNLDKAKPVGALGMLWRLRSRECKEGLGVLVELTKALGKLKASPPEMADSWA
jgi:uncharacterized protein YjgD (DUF1641 family)